MQIANREAWQAEFAVRVGREAMDRHPTFVGEMCARLFAAARALHKLNQAKAAHGTSARIQKRKQRVMAEAVATAASLGYGFGVACGNGDPQSAPLWLQTPHGHNEDLSGLKRGLQVPY